MNKKNLTNTKKSTKKTLKNGSKNMAKNTDMTADNVEENTESEIHKSKRDFIHIMAITGTVPLVGAIAWTSVQQMAPDASVLAMGSKEVDVSQVAKGQAIKVMWRGKPVFIRHRTDNEKKAASGTSLSILKDKDARSALASGKIDAKDENRVLNPDWLVVVGICTHLGCIPLGTADSEEKGDYGGWYCPCHGSHYDTSGRIRKGPAAQNLEVPPYQFVTDSRIKIG